MGDAVQEAASLSTMPPAAEELPPFDPNEEPSGLMPFSPEEFDAAPVAEPVAEAAPAAEPADKSEIEATLDEVFSVANAWLGESRFFPTVADLAPLVEAHVLSRHDHDQKAAAQREADLRAKEKADKKAQREKAQRVKALAGRRPASRRSDNSACLSFAQHIRLSLDLGIVVQLGYQRRR